MHTSPTRDVPSEFAPILDFVDAIFSELNVGLVIHHVPEGDLANAVLLYANREASACTGADLGALVGMRVHEAFPNLRETEVPRHLETVVREQRPVLMGLVEYGDENVRRARWITRAFPMPHECIGVVFVSVRDDPGGSGP